MVEIAIGLGTIIVTLISVYLGWHLSESAARRRELETERKRNEAVRLLISTEIEFNLRRLEEYQLGLEKAEQYYKEHDLTEQCIYTGLAFSTATEPSPAVSFRIWESQLHLIAYTFDKDMLAQIYQFYNQLYYFFEVNNIFSEIREKILDDYDKMEVNSFYSSPYDSMISRYKNVINKIVELGNPLK